MLCTVYSTLYNVNTSYTPIIHGVNQVRSILDYDIDIHPLPLHEQTYTALNMNYSVAGFQVIDNT